MKIGILKEIKENENRVALTPAGARALTGAGHIVRMSRPLSQPRSRLRRVPW